MFTDKIDTLTEGRISFQEATDSAGRPSKDALLLGLLANEATADAAGAVGGNELDRACWVATGATGIRTEGFQRLSILPFDHDRRMTSVLVEDGGRGRLVPSQVAAGGP